MISWSPPGRLCSTVHSSTARTSSSRGLPVGPRRCRTPSQAAANPRRAKFLDRCCCGAESTFTTNAPWPRIAFSVMLPRSKQTRTSGGVSDSEVTALAVVPTGWPSASTEVTTVTPVAKCPIASRNSAADTPEAVSELETVSEPEAVGDPEAADVPGIAGTPEANDTPETAAGPGAVSVGMSTSSQLNGRPHPQVHILG